MYIIRRFLVLHLIMLLAVCASVAQKSVEFDKKNFMQNAKGLRDAKNNITKGDHFAGGLHYDKAIECYLKANEFNPENDLLNFKLGYCYLFNMQASKAMPFLEKAHNMNPEITRDIHYFLAQAYHLTYQFDKAIEQYNADKAKLSKDSDQFETARIDKLILECNSGKELYAKPKKVELLGFGPEVNTDGWEYSLFMGPADTTVIYTQAKVYDLDKKRNSEVNQENIVSKKKNGGSWAEDLVFRLKFNTGFNDASAGLSPDGKKMFIYRERNGGDIYYSEYNNGWSLSKVLPAPINTAAYENSATTTSDGKTLYFVSDRDSSSLGETDIFVSQLEGEKWSQPKNLGPNINTPYKESGVFVTPDGNELYFCSKGHNSMGGYDIFKSVKNGGEWGKAENMGYPINTPDEDLYFSIKDTIAYFTSMREGGSGKSDIYKAIFHKEPKKDSVIVAKVDSTMDPSVYDRLEKVNEFTVIYDFNFKICQHINTAVYPELDKLADYLLKFPSAKIEVVGYTDTQGDANYNQKLSERRASFVKDYLKKKGVKETSFTAKGLGFSKQISKNKDEKGRFIRGSLGYNRRVEFNVVNQGEGKLVVEQIKVPDSLKIEAKTKKTIYSVCLAVLPNGDELNAKYKSVPEAKVYRVKSGTYLYYVGSYENLVEAQTKKNEVIKLGFDKASICVQEFDKLK